MVKFLGKLLAFLISAGALFFVIYFTPPPKSWVDARIWQIMSFFLPLLATFTSLFNLFIKPFARCFCLGLGAIILVVLKTTQSFNLLTVSATLIATFLLAGSFNEPLFIIPRSKRNPILFLKSLKKAKNRPPKRY